MILTKQKIQQALHCTDEEKINVIAEYAANLKQLQTGLANYDDPAQAEKLAQLANKIAENTVMNDLYLIAYTAAITDKQVANITLLREQRRVIRMLINQARLCELYHSGKYQEPSHAPLFHALTAEFLQDCDPQVQISKGCETGNEGLLVAEVIRHEIGNEKETPVDLTKNFNDPKNAMHLRHGIEQNILRDANFFHGIADTGAFEKISQKGFPALSGVINQGLELCEGCGESFSTSKMRPRSIHSDNSSPELSFVLKDAPPSEEINKPANPVAVEEYKGGTYKGMLLAMGSKPAHSKLAANEDTLLHSDPLKVKAPEPVKKEVNKPKIRPDATSTR